MTEPMHQRSPFSVWTLFLLTVLFYSSVVSALHLGCTCNQRKRCILDATAHQSDEDLYNNIAVFSSSSSRVSSPSSTSSSSSFAMNPTSETARDILRESLQLTAEQHQQLAKLAVLVNDWNTRINLISRKDCNRDVIFGRHILPCLAPLAVLSNHHHGDGDVDSTRSSSPRLQFVSGQSVCDVGTGGGLPGLPLAIARPDLQFTLVDSVGKKIAAVQDMADQLGLTNVRTIHGRAEFLVDEQHHFDWVIGRSVAAIPTYAFWIQNLLKKGGSMGANTGDGHLVYLIGGDIEQEILDQAVVDEDIETLLGTPGVSDKRVIIFPETAVRRLALASGEKLRVPSRVGDVTKSIKRTAETSSQPHRKATAARGQWTKRDSVVPKQRGYESFRRFDSLQKDD